MEAERSFLCLDEDDDVLHANLAAQIALLTPADSLRAAAWAGAAGRFGSAHFNLHPSHVGRLVGGATLR